MVQEGLQLSHCEARQTTRRVQPAKVDRRDVHLWRKSARRHQSNSPRYFVNSDLGRTSQAGGSPPHREGSGKVQGRAVPAKRAGAHSTGKVQGRFREGPYQPSGREPTAHAPLALRRRARLIALRTRAARRARRPARRSSTRGGGGRRRGRRGRGSLGGRRVARRRLAHPLLALLAVEPAVIRCDCRCGSTVVTDVVTDGVRYPFAGRAAAKAVECVAAGRDSAEWSGASSSATYGEGARRRQSHLTETRSQPRSRGVPCWRATRQCRLRPARFAAGRRPRAG